MNRATFLLLVCAGLLALALLLPRPGAAAWPTDPLVNVPLCTAASDQVSPTITADGVGGAVVTWQDNRGGNMDIFVQRVDAAGGPQWTADGVLLCSAANDQQLPMIVSDGAGGAIVAWRDLRSSTSYDIYVQRISAVGVPQWTPDGVALCTAPSDQSTITIVSDGAGGAIISWVDTRSGNWDIYAQRISAAGVPQWAPDGVVACIAPGDQSTSTIVSDGMGGAIVVWVDTRGSDWDVYAQRISAVGAPQWAPDGVALCTATGDQSTTMIDSDGAGGAIVSWVDTRSGNWDIYAQRISAAGAPQWVPDGVVVCIAPGDQSTSTIVSDGAGGAIVSWVDTRSGNWDIYAQRISAAGAPQWAPDGVALCAAAGDQSATAIVSDGAGGAIVSWVDPRSGNWDIYTRRISAAGAPQWAPDGVALCTAAGDQYSQRTVSDGVGGAIVTWQDARSGTCDIYAQRVQANGQLGGNSWVSVPDDGSLGFALDPVRPNPTRGGALTVRFALADAATASLELLDVAGRRIATREVGSFGAGRHTLDLGEGRHLAPGLYLVRLRQHANVRVTRAVVLR